MPIELTTAAAGTINGIRDALVAPSKTNLTTEETNRIAGDAAEAAARTAAVAAEATARIAGDLALTLPPPLAKQDATLPLYIIPVMRNFGAGGSETLGLWYSRDGVTVSDLYTGSLFAGTVADDVRDPSLVIRKDGWYIAYTAGSFGAVLYFGIAKSTDYGKTWAFHTNVNIAASVGATWGPSFFTDPVTGQLYIYISFSTGGGNHKAHVMRCLSDDLLTWEAPVALTGDHASETYDIDIRTAYSGGFYYQIASVGSQSPGGGAISAPAIYRSRSVVGPWTRIATPYSQWHSGAATALEQTFITHLGADRWQANFTKVTAGASGGVWTSFSNDNLLTWSAPVQVTSNPTTPHNFSEYVYIPSGTLPVVPSPARMLSVVSSAIAPVANDIPVGQAVIWENTTNGVLTLSVNQGGTVRNRVIGNRSWLTTCPAGSGVNQTTNLDLTPSQIGYPFPRNAAQIFEVIVSTADPVICYQRYIVRTGQASSGDVFVGIASAVVENIEPSDYWDVAFSIPGGTGPLRIAITNKINDGNPAWNISVQIKFLDP